MTYSTPIYSARNNHRQVRSSNAEPDIELMEIGQTGGRVDNICITSM